VRIIIKISAWQQLFERKTQKKEPELIPVDTETAERWNAIVSGMKDWADEKETMQWQANGHAIFCFKQMGLGP
jgi:hypothetical protein